MLKLRLFFDYDGTLMNTDPFNFYANEVACNKLGIPFNTKVYDQYFRGRTLAEGSTNYFKAIHVPLVHLKEYQAFKRACDADYRDWITSYPDAVDAAKHLFKAGHELYIVSGSRQPGIDAGLDKFGIQHIFSSKIIAFGDYPRGKPYPDPYVEALNMFTDPGIYIAIEDTQSGLLSARLAGIPYRIGVTHTTSADDLIDATITMSDLRMMIPYLGPEGSPRGIETENVQFF